MWNAPAGTFIGRAIRNTNTPVIASAAFTDLSATANWLTTGQGVAKGFAAYSNGWTIPATGTYEISYNMVTAGACLVGITVNNASPSVGADLSALGTGAVVQGSSGQSSVIQKELTAGDVVRLFAITSGGSTTAFASIGHFTVTWVSAS